MGQVSGQEPPDFSRGGIFVESRKEACRACCACVFPFRAGSFSRGSLDWGLSNRQRCGSKIGWPQNGLPCKNIDENLRFPGGLILTPHQEESQIWDMPLMQAEKQVSPTSLSRHLPVCLRHARLTAALVFHRPPHHLKPAVCVFFDP